MSVAGPQRGLFVFFLAVGVACLLGLDLVFAPAALGIDDEGRADASGADSGTATSITTPATPIADAAPATRVTMDPAARIPTIVARFELEQKEPSDQSAIRALATAMIEDHGVTIILEGHSDLQGAQDYNHDISLARAEWVKSRLVELGVSPERIQTVGLGSTRPLRSDEADAQSVNRRVEVRWLK